MPDRGPPPATTPPHGYVARVARLLVRPCATKEGRSFTERDQRLRLTLKDMILTQVTLGKVEEYDDMMILPFERMEKVRCVPV